MTWLEFVTIAAVASFEVLARAAAQDQNAVAVTATAAFRKVGDLNAIPSKLAFGGPPECPERPLCLKGLSGQ